ncbi:N-acetylmuramic acid 6-phosphate etherase [Staphylococcus sp. SQ8-PEA]|uniref:N-acetylmuramic acid 6-phosphate etherase n=1 Tax=Staphylococcus marylandisciuri TaxID=2981529 RepID=A0ABT2QMK9_9STAP|nr:N-acetylmuramic acid 6-phosphate etherase [Staphylococcus marylandisciuri]MCU5745219.1 N-acetylmuramic acid 6-phosphate etherase [Staphylococcus marylandisciuri]
MNRMTTEARNPRTMQLDEMTTEEALRTMNEEDQLVPKEIEKVIPRLAHIIDLITQLMKKGGRLIYMGAGTSGRLGVLDAAECVPTFNTKKDDVIGLIAGGQQAMLEAVEGAEDSDILATQDLKALSLSEKDVVIGIAASGKTPYVVGGLEYANHVGATTVAISCNINTPISDIASHPIEINVGPEVLTGSTRLKAGTAQKLILNMISTMTMVGLGKVYGNLMVDLQATNQKLIQRSVGIIQDICDLNLEEAEALYKEAHYHLKPAVVMHLAQCSYEIATKRLEANNGQIKKALI